MKNRGELYFFIFIILIITGLLLLNLNVQTDTMKIQPRIYTISNSKFYSNLEFEKEIEERMQSIYANKMTVQNSVEIRFTSTSTTVMCIIIWKERKEE